MELIINFFEYTLSGWIYFIWFILMIIFSLACLGVVGDKVAKKKEAELKKLREKMAQEEYKKAQELLEKQAQNSGIDMSLDPTANTVSEVKEVQPQEVSEVSIPDTIEEVKPVQEVVVNDNSVQQNVVADDPVQEVTPNTSSAIPIVDNTSEESISEGDVPAVLVIDDNGSSNT